MNEKIKKYTCKGQCTSHPVFKREDEKNFEVLEFVVQKLKGTWVNQYWPKKWRSNTLRITVCNFLKFSGSFLIKARLHKIEYEEISGRTRKKCLGGPL